MPTRFFIIYAENLPYKSKIKSKVSMFMDFELWQYTAEHRCTPNATVSAEGQTLWWELLADCWILFRKEKYGCLMFKLFVLIKLTKCSILGSKMISKGSLKLFTKKTLTKCNACYFRQRSQIGFGKFQRTINKVQFL